ncbi:MAG: hypothetical protein ACHRHE_20355, partial [Tepidisphaerales bacterium]
IVVFIVLYTVVNIYYRKPAPPHRPYEEMVNRTTTARLLAGGWRRLPVDLRRPAEKPAAGEAAITRGAAGIGPGLGDCFVEKPPLLASIDRVAAPREVAGGEACTVYFTASVPDQQLQLGDVVLYQHGNEIVLIPTSEHLPGTRLLSRWADANYGVSFPTSALPPGRYQVRLIARGAAAQWTLTVR